MAEPALAGVRTIAVTVPGMGGTPAPKDLSIENLARLAAQCAADLGCDIAVGFSMGANIALEMAALARSAGRWCCWRPASRAGTRQRSSAFSTGSPGYWGTCHSPRCSVSLAP